MDYNNNSEYELDSLAEAAGGYVSLPDQDGLRFTNLFFDICKQFGIRYSSATAKERFFVDEVTRLTWARIIEEETGIPQNVPLSFSAPAKKTA